MQTLTALMQTDKLEFIKNPMVAEFLGLTGNSNFTESQVGAVYPEPLAEVPDGTRQGVCLCFPSAAHRYGTVFQ